MKSVFIILLSSMLFHVISAFSLGAPDGACTSMTPSPAVGNHGVPPQTSASPYQVTFDKPYFKAGEPVKVMIKSSGSDIMFKGLLVQARKEGSDTPIGTFDDPPAGVKHLKCTNLKDSVTHNGVNRNGWKSISLNWIPPSNVSKMDNISFFATVVQKRDTFWVKIPAMQMNMTTMTTNMPTDKKETTSRPSGTCGAFSPNTVLFVSIVMIISAYTVRL